MFDPLPHPRLFGMPPGADFPAALVDHLRAAYADRPPQDLARVRLIVNTRRMARRIRDLFDQGPALLLPRIELITDLGQSHHLTRRPQVARHLPPAALPHVERHRAAARVGRDNAAARAARRGT